MREAGGRRDDGAPVASTGNGDDTIRPDSAFRGWHVVSMNASGKLVWIGAVALALALGGGEAAAAKARRGAKKPAPAAAKATNATPTYADRADVRAFIDEMHTDYGFDARDLKRVFGEAHFQP